MHENSKKLMKNFIQEFVSKNNKIKVLDVGSLEVDGGNYKELFQDMNNVTYLGIDANKGKNVDRVVLPYDWDLNEEFDVLISGQCVEHVEDLHAWFEQASKVVMSGGLICVIAPCNCFTFSHCFFNQ